MTRGAMQNELPGYCGPTRTQKARQARRVARLGIALVLVGAVGTIARPLSAQAATGDISTIAGTGSAGYTGDGGPATAARLNQPADVAVDASGNEYVADLGNHVVRKIDTSGVITTVAGTGTSGFSGDGGLATSAELNQPFGLVLDSSGHLYIADQGENRIRVVDLATGIISEFAGNGSTNGAGDVGPATGAGLQPQYMAITPAGLFVTDDVNNEVWKIDGTGTISTYASGISEAEGLAADSAGDLYATSFNGNVVDKIDTSGHVTVVAGNGSRGYSGDGGPATLAQLHGPYDVTFLAGALYFSEWYNGTVRKVDPSGTISTVAGNGSSGYSGDGGPATSAQLNNPTGLAFGSGGLLIADLSNNVIRGVSGIGPDLLAVTNSAPTSVLGGQTFAYTMTVSNPGGAGTATGVALSDPLPAGLSIVSATTSSGTCTLSGSTVTCSLGQLVEGGSVTVSITVTAPTSGSGVLSNTVTVSAAERDPDPADNTATAVTTLNPADVSVTAAGSVNPATPGATLTYTLAAHNAGPADATSVVVTDTLPPEVVFGSASASQGTCSQSGAAVTCVLGAVSAGNTVTVSVSVVPSPLLALLTDVASVSATNPDPNLANNTATVQTAVTDAIQTITTFAGLQVFPPQGDGGPATSANLSQPTGVAEDGAGNVYIAEYARNDVRKVATSGTITTVVGTGTPGYAGDGGPATAAELNQPLYLAIDAAGNLLIDDAGNNAIREVTAAGTISTVAGTGAAGYSGDGGPATSAKISGPQAVAALPGGGFVIADCGNNVVRKVDVAGTITTIAGNGMAGDTGDGGPATSAELGCAGGLAVDSVGDLFIADQSNNVVRKVDATGTISTIAGTGIAGFSGDGGPAINAQFNNPYGLVYDAGYLFVGDYNNNRVREINPAGIITTVVGNGSRCTIDRSPGAQCGDGGPPTLAGLNHPGQIVVDSSANLLIAGNISNTVREVSAIGPDLLHISAATPPSAAAGSPYPVAFTVVNPGDVGTATGVTLKGTLPAGDVASGALSTQGRCTINANIVSCAIGQLAPFDFATVTITSTAPSLSVSSVTETAAVTSVEVDPAPGDNTVSVTRFVTSPLCGTVFTTSTKLTSDIGPCLADGVIIGADNITLNLNGHRIFGLATRADDIAGIRLPFRTGVTIENGSVTGFATGLYINSGYANTVTNMNIHDNLGPPNCLCSNPAGVPITPDFGDGIFIADSSSNKILNSTINHNGWYDGVGIDGLDANFNVVSGNVITNNTNEQGAFNGSGVVMDAAPLDLNDPRRGQSIYGNNVIGNTITGNSGSGISSVSNVNGLYEFNDVERNGLDTNNLPDEGIGLQRNSTATTATDDTVANNTVVGNGTDGIATDIDLLEASGAGEPSGNKILNNTVTGNAVNPQGNSTDPINCAEEPCADLNDQSGVCTLNVWSGNTYGSAGVIPSCLAATNTATAATAAVAPPTTSHAPVAQKTPPPRGMHGQAETSATQSSIPPTTAATATSSGTGCGQVVTTNLTLTANIGPCTGPGLIIQADNITVNLNGHSVVGPGPTNGTNPGIDIETHTGVTVENGSVSNFDVGVFINMSAAVTVTNLNVHDNIGPDPDPSSMSGGITIFHSSGGQIVNNVLTHNGVNAGIGVFGIDSDANVIKGNTVTGSVRSASTGGGGLGIDVTALLEPTDPRRGDPIDGNNVLNNTVTGNQGAGIVSDTNINALIRGNTVKDNGVGAKGDGDGIQLNFDVVGGASPRTVDTVLGNTSLGNGDNGIDVVSRGNTIQGNSTGANNVNQDGSFDLIDANPGCDNNVWKGNTWGSAGFSPSCTST